MKRLNNKDRALLKKAFYEAYALRYDLALSHTERATINSHSVKEKKHMLFRYCGMLRRPAVICAVILVAVSVICGCTASEPTYDIAGFRLVYKNDGIEVFSHDKLVGHRHETDRFTLGYVPEGYEKVSEEESESCVGMPRWVNSDGDELYLRYVDDSGMGGFDNKGDEKYAIQYDGGEMLFLEVSDSDAVCIFRRGIYNMKISMNERFSDDEMRRMVESVYKIDVEE